MKITLWCTPQHGRSSGHRIGAVVNRCPARVGVLVHAWAVLRSASLLVGGAQNRSGGINHRSVAYWFIVLIFDALHGLQLGHAVRELTRTGDQRLNIVLDSRLVQTVNLVFERHKAAFIKYIASDFSKCDIKFKSNSAQTVIPETESSPWPFYLTVQVSYGGLDQKDPVEGSREWSDPTLWWYWPPRRVYPC